MSDPDPDFYFKPKKDCIVQRFKNDSEIKCSCGVIPNIIYYTWFLDNAMNKMYLKYLCHDCSKVIFKTPGYFHLYLETLRERFRDNVFIEEEIF